MGVENLPSIDELINLSRNTSATQLGLKYQVSTHTIIKRLRSAGIDTSIRRKAKGNAGNKYKIDKERLYDFYWNQHLSYEKIAEIIGCDFTSIPYWLKEFNIPRRKIWETRRPKGWTPPDPEIVSHLYNARGIGTNPIGKMFGVSGQYIADMLRKEGIEIQPAGYPKLKRYSAKDGHYIRSGLELQVDDWLFEHNLDHAYEPEIPNSRKKSDFLVKNTYIEIWGIESSEKYNRNTKEKLIIYQSMGLNLISLYKQDFPNLEKLSVLLS